MSGKVRVSKASRKLPRDKAFYFFTSIGNYTGESAISLDEFTKKILDVDVKSLEFHLYRGDFERWINGTLEDVGLARKIKQLKSLQPIGIDLRDRLYLIVSKHYESLKKPATHTTSFAKPKTTTISFGRSEREGKVRTQTQDVD